MGFLAKAVSRGMLLSLLAISGCASDPPTEASIRLILDTSPEGGCQSANCEDFGMSCGATVSLRLTDPNSGELLFSESGEALAICRAASVNRDICSLAALAPDMLLFGMPARPLRVEVAIWNEDDVAADACPTTTRFELFDTFGRPQPNFSPSPAFAGAAFFRAGVDSDVVVPLTCLGPEQLDDTSCAANLPTDVTASVIDMATMQPLRKEQASDVAVAVGVARAVSDNEGGSFYELKAADTFSLRLNNEGATPLYQEAVLLPFIDDLVCSSTLQDEARATASVLCEEVADGEELLLSPLLLQTDVLDAALLVLGIENFPESGLLIGRVVDEGFSPAPGISITPSIGSVVYLSEDLTEVSPLSSASGFFVSTNVPFGATWSADHFDGRTESGSPRGGLIAGKLSTLTIRMTGSVIGE